MSTELHTPRIQPCQYMGIVFRIGITKHSVFWNVAFQDRTVSGRSKSEAAAKGRAKQEIQRAIERYERELASISKAHP